MDDASRSRAACSTARVEEQRPHEHDIAASCAQRALFDVIALRAGSGSMRTWSHTQRAVVLVGVVEVDAHAEHAREERVARIDEQYTTGLRRAPSRTATTRCHGSAHATVWRRSSPARKNETSAIFLFVPPSSPKASAPSTATYQACSASMYSGCPGRT